MEESKPFFFGSMRRQESAECVGFKILRNLLLNCFLYGNMYIHGLILFIFGVDSCCSFHYLAGFDQ